MKSKINLLFLGRGVYLKNLYKKYKGESFTKFLVDLDVDRNTTKVFKKTYRINLNYKEKILNLAKKLKIKAVITNQNDFSMISYGYLCTKLSLPGIPFKITKRFSDKNINRKYLRNKKNLKKYIPTFFNNYKKFLNSKKKIKNLIIKPTNLQGSRYVFKLNKKNFFEKINFFKNIKQKYLIEQYINGENYAVESLVLNKKIINLLISKKTKFPNSFIDRKIIFQSNFNSKLQKRIVRINNLIISILGLRNGLTHLEFKVNNKNQIFLIEAACRGAGSGISNIIIPYLTGIDTDEFLYLLSINRLKNYNPKIDRIKKKCTLEWLYPHQKISQKIIKSKKNLFFQKKKLQKLQKVQQSTDRGGYFINII